MIDLKLHTGRIGRRLTALGLAIALTCSLIPFAGAVTQEEIDEMKSQQSALQSQMDDLQDEIDALEDQENSALSQALLYQEQMGLLTEQIADTTALIADYEAQIEVTQAELEEAQAKAESYYQLFCERVRDLEESGSFSYWSILFGASSFSDLLDRIYFIRDVVNYDNNVVDALEAARQEVADAEAELESEKAALEEALAELTAQQEQIQAASDKNDALLAEIQANQEAYADQLAELESESDDLEDEIAVSEEAYAAQVEALRKQAEAEAAAKKAAEEAAAKAAEEAAKAAEEEKKNNDSSDDDDDDDSDSSDNSGSSTGSTTTTSSATGAQVASYACQFIGNPYVWGGTSLTNGCDCSGFVMQVYKHFGVSLSHSSHAQAKSGVAVSYSEAQPGDIIYYNSSSSASGGHVGIYIGNGQMVSALGSKWGICITTVNPNKSGFTVRRIFTKRQTKTYPRCAQCTAGFFLPVVPAQSPFPQPPLRRFLPLLPWGRRAFLFRHASARMRRHRSESRLVSISSKAVRSSCRLSPSTRLMLSAISRTSPSSCSRKSTDTAAPSASARGRTKLLQVRSKMSGSRRTSSPRVSSSSRSIPSHFSASEPPVSLRR